MNYKAIVPLFLFFVLAGTGSAFAQYESDPRTFLALVNTSLTEHARIFVSTAVSYYGLGCGSGTIDLPPRGKVSRSLSEVFGRTPCPGWLRVSSSAPIAAAFIEVAGDAWITYPFWRFAPSGPQ